MAALLTQQPHIEVLRNSLPHLRDGSLYLRAAITVHAGSLELSYLHRLSPASANVAQICNRLPYWACTKGKKRLLGNGSTFGKRLHSSTSSA